MPQDFHMTRFEEFREKGMAHYNAGQWKDARYNLLRAAEYLFKLANATPEGKIRDQRKANAQKLVDMAKKIDENGPPPPVAKAAAKATRKAAEGEDDRKKFAQ